MYWLILVCIVCITCIVYIACIVLYLFVLCVSHVLYVLHVFNCISMYSIYCLYYDCIACAFTHEFACICIGLYWSVLCQYWFNNLVLLTNTCKYMAIHTNTYCFKILGWKYAFNTLMIVLACIDCISMYFFSEYKQYTC